MGLLRIVAKEKEPKKEAAKQAQESKPKASSAILKKRKKRWYGIVAPQEFNSKRIGETLAGEPNEMLGRSVKINLMNLIDDYKKQGINIHFKVEAVNDDNAVCKTIGYEMLKSHARRMVRKGADKMDDSFIAQAKDGGQFRVKPVVVTRNMVPHSALGMMRKIIRDYVIEKFKELSSIEVFEAAIQSKLQREMRSSIAKICPVSACEIRTLEIIQQ